MFRLSLLYRVLIWTLLPLLGVIGFSYLQTGYIVQQMHQGTEQQLTIARSQVRRALIDQLETVGQVALLVAESKEVVDAFEDRQTDWLYRWGRRFIDSGLVTEMHFVDPDGVLLACGHDEFNFNEDLSSSGLFKTGREGTVFLGLESLEGSPKFTAAVPVYRFETILVGVVLVSEQISDSLLAGIGQSIGSRIGLEVDSYRVGTFVTADAGNPADTLSTEFDLDIPTLRGNPVRMQLSNDTTEDTLAVEHLSSRLVGFSTLAMALFAVLAVVVVQRMLRPVRELRGELHALSRGRIGLDDAMDRLQRLVPLRNELGEIAESAVAALGRLHDVQQQLKQSENEARVASRAKTEFLSNMSHEIRTPLNAILGFTELLRDSRFSSREQRYIDTVHRSGETLAALINDILDLSKIEAGKLDIHLAPMRLDSLLEEQRDLFATKVLEKGLEFILELDPDLPGVLMLDEIRLRQILLNLLGNAVKFTENGFVKLSTVLVRQTEGEVNLEIRVEDTGPGVPACEQERIFGVFEQRDPKQGRQKEGSGLGLAISRRLAELMDAELQLRSEEGIGSRFTLHMPVVGCVDAPERTEGSETSLTRHFRNGTVLVADDVAEGIELIQEHFRGTPVHVVGANDGATAVRLARELVPNLILMDIRMPGLDGYEATRILKSDPQTRSIPVVAATASVLETEEDDERQSMFDGFLPKPLRLQQLEQELSRHLPHSIEVMETVTEGCLNDIEETCAQAASEFDERQWRQLLKLRSSGSIEQIRNLAVELRASKSQVLQGIGEMLQTAAEEFDIALMERLLKGLTSPGGR